MKLRYWLLIAAALLVVTSYFASAEPPFLESQEATAGGLQIEYPKNEFYPVNTEVTLHFHVYNSTGYILDNTTTSCIMHIYNLTGNHIVETDMEFDSNSIDFKQNFSTEGLVGEVHTYVVQCNSSIGEAGFVSSAFEFTEGGFEPGDELALFVLITAFGITFILIGLFLLSNRRRT